MVRASSSVERPVSCVQCGPPAVPPSAADSDSGLFLHSVIIVGSTSIVLVQFILVQMALYSL